MLAVAFLLGLVPVGLICAVLEVPVAAQAPAPSAEQAGEKAVQANPAAASSEATDTAPGDSAASEAEQAGWMHTVDELFGRMVVDPLDFLLFFDFWTGVPFVVAWLFCGAVFFTLRMNFINLRGFWHAIRLTRGDYDNPDDAGEVSHFQALAAALSATVGLGNIAGVAIAVGIGGPGACFWMIVVGLLGMTSKFAECTLGQIYRKLEADGTVTGGPMRYLRLGLAEMNLGWLGSVLSVVFAVLCIGASFGGGCAFQVGQSLTAIQQDFPLLRQAPWLYGLLMAVMAGIVIIGGIKSIGAVAGKIVPFMCGAYVLAAIYILIVHAARIPEAVALIFNGAFNPVAIQGGIVGVMVQGIRRAVFSNEAGVGSAAIAHSAAKTEEPVSEGIVALLEPFIDTVVVCTMTALVIVVTGAYRLPSAAEIQNPRVAYAKLGDLNARQKLMRQQMETQLDGDQKLIRSWIENKDGAPLTAYAFETGGNSVWFRYLLYAAVVLFAYSTLISWSYYGERCWTTLFGVRASMAYKVLFLGFIVLGSIITRSKVLEFSDLLILGMSFPNILGVALLSGKVKRRLDDYWGRYRRGELEPVRKPFKTTE